LLEIQNEKEGEGYESKYLNEIYDENGTNDNLLRITT